MGDHFVLLMDRLLTESTLEDVIQNDNRLQHALPPVSEYVTDSLSFHRMDVNVRVSSGELAECKICHDEDEESNMEIPCSCRGSLKYAHRKCIQRWCNEKGDTICEICHQLYTPFIFNARSQPFTPGYTAPPPLFHIGGIPMNFRGNWDISRRELQHPQFMSMVSTDGNFFEPDTDDYPVTSSRSLICCRIVAIIFMVLLVLRHTLPFILYGAGEYSFSLIMLLLLRTIGILLPIYIMVKALTAIKRRRNRQDPPIFPVTSSDEESELARHPPQSHLIHVP